MTEFYEKIGNEITLIMKESDGDICDALAENDKVKLSFAVTILPGGMAGIKMSCTVKKLAASSHVNNQTKLNLK